MNSKDYRNIREAYLQVYAPQELTEEQVWEEVENWVNSLLEEGYDLSDYTWEEMYEGYITEILGAPNAEKAGAKVRELGGAIVNKGVSDVSKLAKGAADVAGAYGQGFAGQKTTSSNPLAKGYNAASRLMSTPARAVASFGAGVLGLGSKSDGGKVKSTTVPGKSASTDYKSKFARPKNATPGLSNIPKDEGTGIGGPSDLAKKYGKDTTSYQSGGGARSGKSIQQTMQQGRTNLGRMDQGKMAPAGAKPTSGGSSVNPKSGLSAYSASKPTSPTPSSGSSSGSGGSSGSTPKPAASTTPKFDVDKTGIKPPTTFTKPAAATPEPTPSAEPSGETDRLKKALDIKKSDVTSSFDMFDVVKGYLIGEGYADTEHAAEAIMANMSDAWVRSIIG